MSLGAEIRRLRDGLGLSQRALAGRVGVSQAYIGQLEGGARTGLTADMLFGLSDALGVGCDHWRPHLTPAAGADAPRSVPAAEPRRTRKPRTAPGPDAPPAPAGKPARKPRSKPGG